VGRKHSVRDSGLELTRSWRGALPEGGYDALRQLLILVTAYIGYDLIRIATRGREALGVENAQRLINGEKALHIFWEPWLQARAIRFDAVIHFFNWFYGNVHLPAIVLTLIWLYLYHHDVYPFFRNVFLLMNAIGLAIFAMLPMAPPRFTVTSGMVDTITVYSNAMRPQGYMGFETNQYAAMPSLHFGFAVFTSLLLILLCRSLAVRIAAVVYTVLVFLAIVVTGNHFILDAAGGVLVLAFAFAAVFVASRSEAPGALALAIRGEAHD